MSRSPGWRSAPSRKGPAARHAGRTGVGRRGGRLAPHGGHGAGDSTRSPRPRPRLIPPSTRLIAVRGVASEGYRLPRSSGTRASTSRGGGARRGDRRRARPPAAAARVLRAGRRHQPAPGTDDLHRAVRPDHPGPLALGPDAALRCSALVEVVEDGPWARHVVVVAKCSLGVGGRHVARSELPSGATFLNDESGNEGGAPFVLVSGTDRIRRREEAAVRPTARVPPGARSDRRCRLVGSRPRGHHHGAG